MIFRELTDLEILVLMAHMRSAAVDIFTCPSFDYGLGKDQIDFAEDVMNEIQDRDLKVSSIHRFVPLSAWQID